MVLDEIDAAWSLVDRVKKLINKDKHTLNETVASRFVQLFEAHDVHRNQIPRLFGHGLEIAHVKDDDSLHNHLTEEILDDACVLFGIRREWLDCAEDKIYEVQSFYKNIETFNGYLDDIKAKQSDWLMAYLILSTQYKDEHDTLLIISEQIGTIGDKTISRYYLINGWIHRYWKCRPELAVCTAMLLNKEIHLKGKFVKESINRFCDGKEFCNEIFGYHPIRPVNCLVAIGKMKIWEPEKWLYDPQDFCKGLDEGNFGKTNALAYWLDYYKKGLLKTGYSQYDCVKKFEDELAKLSSA